MRRAMEARGFSEAALSKRLDIKRASFNHYLNDRSEPKFETLLAFCQIVGVDVGDIIRSDDNGPLNMRLEPQDDEFVKIDVFDVALAAGAGRIASSETPVDQLAFRTAWLDRIGVNPAHASIVHVEGDSMEPTLQSGSIVLIDHRNTTPTTKTHIFAIRQGEALKVKRVERSIKDQSIMLVSDNPSWPIEHMTGADLNGFEIIGRVVWSARTWPL